MRYELRAMSCGIAACAAVTFAALTPPAVSAAEPGPTALVYVRSPKALWDGLASLAPNAQVAGVMQGFLDEATEGADLARPLGVRVEFDENESFFYRVAIPTTDGTALLDRMAPLLLGLRKANADGSRDFAGGVVQARDGHLFFATDEDRLKTLRGAASLLPANAPEADVLATFRPRTIPGILRRNFLDGLEDGIAKGIADAEAKAAGGQAAPFGNTPENPPLTPEVRLLTLSFVRASQRASQEFTRRIVQDTEEITLAIRIRKESLEVEWTLRQPADLPEGRRFEERAAPSRFAAWNTDDAVSFLGESAVGSKTAFTTALRDEVALLRKNPPARELKLPHEDLPALLGWAEKYLNSGKRDWATVTRRVDDRTVAMYGLADPQLGEIGPALSKLTAEFFSHRPKEFEFEPAAWKEGAFVVDLIVPIAPIGQDEQADAAFRREFGKNVEFAVAYGPDRILVVIGENCRGQVRKAIEETAVPRDVPAALAMRMDAAGQMRRSPAVYEAIAPLTDFHKARLKEILAGSPGGEADRCDMRVNFDGRTQVATLRLGHTVSRAFALFFGAGAEQGFAKAKAAAEGN